MNRTIHQIYMKTPTQLTTIDITTIYSPSHSKNSELYVNKYLVSVYDSTIQRVLPHNVDILNPIHINHNLTHTQHYHQDLPPARPYEIPLQNPQHPQHPQHPSHDQGVDYRQHKLKRHILSPLVDAHFHPVVYDYSLVVSDVVPPTFLHNHVSPLDVCIAIATAVPSVHNATDGTARLNYL